MPTLEHIDHMKWISSQFNILMSAKYTKGIKEHGGHLKDYDALALTEYALDEAIDQVVYLITLRDKLITLWTK
jgi:hypothetical protein